MDDDDIWLPEKLSIQIKEMTDEKFGLSSTEGYYGEGIFNPEKKYKLYNKQHYIKDLKYIYKDTKFLSRGNLPRVWDCEFTKVHNCFITSSVIVERKYLIHSEALGIYQDGQTMTAGWDYSNLQKVFI